MRAAHLLASLAAIGMAVSTVGTDAFASPAIQVGMCGAPGSVEIPLDGSPPRHRKDCSLACHAIGGRKKTGSDSRVRTIT